MGTITSPKPTITAPRAFAGKWIVFAVLVAGTLDIVSAILLNGALSGSIKPLVVLKAVASGVFGKEAFAGGIGMAIAGLIFHYLIAFLFTMGYFLVFPYFTFLRKHPVISGLLYGIIVWLIMNRIVVPLSNFPQNPGPFRWDRALMNMAVLMCMIGLPISLFVHKYYTGKTTDRYE